MTADDVITTTCRLSKPAQRALAAAGITTYAHLATWTVQDLSTLHGIGPHAMASLRQGLAERALVLAGDVQRARPR